MPVNPHRCRSKAKAASAPPGLGPFGPGGDLLIVREPVDIAMLSDRQISILFDIASNGGAGLAPDKLLAVIDLVADGYVEARKGSGQFYQLTAQGQRFLSDRGGGVNES